MDKTQAYYDFMRGVAERKRTLLLNGRAREYIYSPHGEIWEPSKMDLARCDAFILFFVVELEYYFERTIEKGLSTYRNIYSSYFLRNCTGGDQYILKISEVSKQLAKNHNANWSKISNFFVFLGMGKESHFPDYYWDDIETIVMHRGHLAHNGAMLRLAIDRRDIIRNIELTIKRTGHFDRHFQAWLNDTDKEYNRIKAINLEFRPPPIL